MSMTGEWRVRMIPVADGDVVDMGPGPKAHLARSGVGLPSVDGLHKLVGFKPGVGSKAVGWLVILVDETQPASTFPHKRRQPRQIRAAS